MERSTILAGFGGQGLLFAGQVLARAAVEAGLHAFWIPAYGPEMRGGTAACTVIVGDAPIGSPVLDAADAVIALNPPSLARYGPLAAPGGLVVVNESLIEADVERTDVEVVRVPCTALAARAGDDRLVSVVALGALLSRRPFVPLEAVRSALAALVGARRPELLETDLGALEAGLAAGGAQPAAAGG